jgi:hypothetical protein
MARKIDHATIRKSARTAIHIIKVTGPRLAYWEIEDIAEQARQTMLSKMGEQLADVVVLQDEPNGIPLLFGAPDSVARVRSKLRDAVLLWEPIDLTTS